MSAPKPPTVLGAFAYPMVLASLPRHGDLFSAKRPPISRIGLERRLRLLPLADQAEIDAIEGLLSWDRAVAYQTDARALAQADRVLALIRSPRLRTLVAQRIAMRSVVAALRHRAEGAAPLAADGSWGRTPHAWRIARRWEAPGFALGPAEAWAVRADRAMRAAAPLQMEREILGEVWRRLTRAASALPAGYEAIVIYVLQWNVIDRWTRYDAAAARVRFEAWVEALYQEGAAHAALAP